MSYAIENLRGDHLGFLLFSGEGESGDCIFRCLPRKREVFDAPESMQLTKLQEEGEFRWRMKNHIIEVSTRQGSVIARIENGRCDLFDMKLKFIKLTNNTV